MTFSKNKRLYNRGHEFSDDEIIMGIKNKDQIVFNYIYERYSLELSDYIVKGRKLDEEDAKDIFQDAMIVLWKNFKNPDFKIKYNFVTYFFGICRNLMMDRLEMELKLSREIFDVENEVEREDEEDEDEIEVEKEKKKKWESLIPREPNEIISDFFPLTDIKYQSVAEIKFQLYIKHFEKLKNGCKEVLRMTSDGIPYSEIAKQMGYKNGNYTKNKKLRCKQYLMDSISRDEMFKLLKK